jgi:hypothetical protein
MHDGVPLGDNVHRFVRSVDATMSSDRLVGRSSRPQFPDRFVGGRFWRNSREPVIEQVGRSGSSEELSHGMPAADPS